MKKLPVTILALGLFLSGCATRPKSPEEWATFYLTEAKTAFAKGDIGTAARQIANALERPTGASQIKQLFTTTPQARDLYFADLESRISEISSPASALSVQDRIDNARMADILWPVQISVLQSNITKRVQIGNESGTIEFDLTDKIMRFPILTTSEPMKLITTRTIQLLQSERQRSSQVDGLMNYVAEQGKSSEEGRRVEALLPSLKIRRNEVDAVGRIFPAYAAIRKSELTAEVVLQVKNGDRLLSEDLLQNLRLRVLGVNWVSTPSAKPIYLVIERIRADEKILPERTETVTYAQHEVNFLAAALLMPRNASFIYEVSSGGAEIEFGYAVTATFDQRTVHDELVRGKVGGEFRRCQNARVHNVFGGVTSAGFVANDDMQRRCSGPNSVSIDELRKDVLSKLVDSVLKVPQIKAINDLN